MKNILLFFALLLTTIGFSQNDETLVNTLVAQKMAELEMQGNPEYFFRKDYCVGNIKIFKLRDGERCASQSTYYKVYVFWKEVNNTFMIQKFDNCGSYRPFAVEFNKNTAKALKDKQALKTEEVKPYVGEKVDDEAYGNMSVESCHKEYKFVFNGGAFEKKYKEYDLTNDSKYENINAEHNNSLVLIELDSEISEMVNYFETNGKFFREN